jgi:hypothetical protein
MAQQEEWLSLGCYLQSLRIKKGFGLHDVCSKTHISRQNLIYIETDDYKHLPAQVHVKGFLKSYADLLNISSERVLQRYAEELIVWQYSDKAHGLDKRLKFWLRFLGAISLLIVIVVAILYTTKGLNGDSQVLPETVTGGNASQFKLPEPIKNMESNEMIFSMDASIDSDNLKLKIVTFESTQLKVIIDGQIPQIYQLKPEDRLDLEAKVYFNILLDNASGVDVYFNEEPIRLSGKPGQNVTIQLP